jgi:dihydrofolate reductase
MTLSIIVAAAENGVIGHNNNLIWHLSSDLKHFKNITTGHTVIMGRKTFESMGKALPNRRNIVITANKAYTAPGCEIVPDIESALQLAAQEEEAFIIGGGTIYRAIWEKADKLYLTRVHTAPTGDISIPEVKASEWQEISREAHSADEKNEYDYTFLEYRRIR